MKPINLAIIAAAVSLTGFFLIGLVSPDDRRPEVKLELGRRFAAAGQFDRAIELFDDVLMEVPRHAVAFHQRGLALDGVDEAEAALSDLDAAISLDPAYTDAINDRGILLARLGRDDDALADFRRVIGLDPNHDAARLNYAVALQRSGRIDEALTALEAIPDGNDDATVAYLKACIWLSQGRLVAAEQLFDRLVTQDADNTKAWLHRGLCRWRLGRHDQGVADLEQAVRLDDELMLAELVAELKTALAERVAAGATGPDR